VQACTDVGRLPCTAKVAGQSGNMHRFRCCMGQAEGVAGSKSSLCCDIVWTVFKLVSQMRACGATGIPDNATSVFLTKCRL
jgi:hypothetical protein